MKRRGIALVVLIVICLTGCQEKTEAETPMAENEVLTTEVTTEIPDTTSPVIELASDGVAYYEGDKYDPMGYVVSVTDDSGESIKAEYDDKDVNIASPGDYVISYSATDSAGNISEKKLKFKVKKEYSRDEIKEIIQELIDEKYYIFTCVDETELDESEYAENSLYGALSIYGNFEQGVTNAPLMGFYTTDKNIYTSVGLVIHVNSENYGRKNNNTNTLNSEVLIFTYEQSGETQVCNDESVEIFSDFGKIKMECIFDKGNFCFNKSGYSKAARTYFCYESEAQIEKFKNILNSTNVGVKITRETGESSVLSLNKSQCDNWLKTISFYGDLNEYVNNIPKE